MERPSDELGVGEPVEAAFFRRRSADVARDLVGTLLLVDREDGPTVGGVVVETEAYVAHVDPACHLAAGRTDRTESFFSGPGTVYVYVIYGHHNLNLITRQGGHPEGVLIRALAPTRGLDRMRERRGFQDATKLTSGPGRLTEALGVTREEFDDRPLAETSLRVERTDLDPDVAVGPRIGISAAEDWPLRCCAADSGFLSKPVSADPDLDHVAVADAYARLAGEEPSLLDD
jgi:DNA-3-methyladenine glycosylase